jgi:kumamolisin
VRVGAEDPSAQVRVSLVVRRGDGRQLPDDAAVEQSGDPVERRAAFAANFGASPEDLAAVARFAEAHDLRVESSDAARRTVTVSGSVAAADAAFGVSPGRYQVGDVSYRGREGHVHIPAELAQIVEAVLGLDDRPQARMHLTRGGQIHEDDLPSPNAGPVAHPTPLWTSQVAQLYGFPTDVTGAQQTIGIIELGGDIATRNSPPTSPRPRSLPRA